MPEPRKLRVFLCHSSNDKPAVRELYQRLKAEGWIDPWLDEEKLYPGQDWDLEIEKAVETADAVIVFLSNNSVTKEGYIQRELRFVLRIADFKPEGTVFVIPLRLDDCPMPRRLSMWQCVDYFLETRKDWAYERLLGSLKIRAKKIGVEVDVGDDENEKDKRFEPTLKTVEKHQSVPEKVGDIEKINNSLLIQDDLLKQQFKPQKYPEKFNENSLPFLVGGVFDLSKASFDAIYQFSQSDENFFERLVKSLNKLVRKSISYCQHPHSKDVLPKFSLFFYGYGFGKAVKGLDSFARRLGLISGADENIPTAPVRDLLSLTRDTHQLPDTPNAAELNKYWEIYREDIVAQYIDMEFDDAPLIESLKIARIRFADEREKRNFRPLLLVVTSGKFSDGNYAELVNAANALKNDGITLVVGFIGKNDVMPNQVLLSNELSNWNDEIKALFLCSSKLERSSEMGKAIAEMAVEKSWKVPDKAKLFLQVNQQEMLEDLIDIIISPLRD